MKCQNCGAPLPKNGCDYCGARFPKRRDFARHPSKRESDFGSTIVAYGGSGGCGGSAKTTVELIELVDRDIETVSGSWAPKIGKVRR